MFRSRPPKVFSNKDNVQIGSKSTGEQTSRSTNPTKPICNFIEITPMHECALRIHITLAKHFFPGEHLQETVCENSFERLKLFTTVIYNC